MSGSGRRRPQAGTAALLLLPSLVVFVVFVFYPLVRTAWLGLHRSDFFGGNRVWVGIGQYTEVIGDEATRHSLWVTLVYTLLTVPLGLALGVGLAVLANRTLRGIGFFRTVFSSTVATSVAVASLMFFVLFQPSIGLLPKVLPFEVLDRPGILNDPGTALFAVAVTTIWQNLGFTFIVVSAGLQSIPRELYESAELDGLSPARQFRDITLPLLSPTLLFGVVVLTVVAFQSFGQVDLLTQGGPLDATNLLVYSVYDNAFGPTNDEGVASVQAMVLFVLLAVLSLAQFRFLERRVHYA
ncbi:MAG: sugar ABC transporter permease [Acidimicrobiales bacterium]|nr:sugar ABC transporter permease [Acidimicrobiales bacterium]